MTKHVCFVFGSNLAGRNGAGSALHAQKFWGAVYGVGCGYQVSANPSRSCYAIPTKGYRLEVLSLERVAMHVDGFLSFAADHPDIEFEVVAIGTGLAGYSPEQIAPMFRDAPSNCDLPPEFKKVLEEA